MLTLCKFFGVRDTNYASRFRGKSKKKSEFEREIDFYLIGNDKSNYKCEVKLMGRGNPESADAVIARDSKVFIADKLSDTNKSQLDSLGIEWVELRSENGFKRFGDVLRHLNIPYQDFNNDAEIRLSQIFREIF